MSTIDPIPTKTPWVGGLMPNSPFPPPPSEFEPIYDGINFPLPYGTNTPFQKPAFGDPSKAEPGTWAKRWPPSRPLPVPDRAPRLFFTIAMQRAGKSTKGRAWLHRTEHLGFEDDGFPRYLWDTDFLRLAVHGERYNHNAEGIIFGMKAYSIKASLLAGHDVFVAGTHTTKTSIRRILEIDPGAIPVVVDTPLSICLDRAVRTKQPDLLPVIERSHAQLRAILDQGISEVIAEILDEIRQRRGK